MFAKQLAVFMENRHGRLGEVLGVLKENNINILSLSLADTTEYGLLRLIVNQPELGKDKLTQKGFSSMLSHVLIIEIPHTSGSLQGLLKKLEEESINIEYMYGLSIDGEQAYVVLKTSDLERADEVIDDFGMHTVSLEKLLTI